MGPRVRRTDAQVRGSVRGAVLGWRVPAHCPVPEPSPGLYQEVQLEELTTAELTGKLAELLGLPVGQILRVSRQGPSGIHILVSDAVRTGEGGTHDTSGQCQTLQPPWSLGVSNLLPARLSPHGCPLLQWDGGLGSRMGRSAPTQPPSPRVTAPQMIRNLLDETCFVVAVGKGNTVARGRGRGLTAPAEPRLWAAHGPEGYHLVLR